MDEKFENFIIYTNVSYSPETEVYVSYGSKPNSHFLKKYGFVNEDFDHCLFGFAERIVETDPMYNEKIAMFPFLEDSLYSFEVDHLVRQETFMRFLAFLRFKVADNDNDMRIIFVSLAKK